MSDEQSFELAGYEKRMKGSINSLNEELSGLRAGRANPAMLETVTAEAYGSDMPLNQIASVSALDARTLTVNVWDATLAPAVGKGIENAGLGLNPIVEGAVIRIPIPELTRERRQELCKTVTKLAENAKIAVRNIRRDGMNKLKRLEKDKLISEDEHSKNSKKLQQATDNHISEIDNVAQKKEQDVMAI